STVAPDFDGVGGYVEGSYSQFQKAGLDALDLRGALNLPLVDDRLAMRVAGVYRDDEGYIENVNPASSDDSLGGGDTGALRLKLRWLLADRLQLDTAFNYQDIRQYKSTFAYEGQVPDTGGDSGRPALFTQFDDREDFGDFAGRVDGEVKDASAHLSWEAGFADVDFLAYYQEFSNESNENRLPFPGSEELFNIGLDFEITTLELRFSDSTDNVDYVTGLYYFERPADGLFNVVVTDVEVNGDSTGVDEGYAVFGNVSFRLAPDWELGLGARYDSIDSTLDSDVRFLNFVSLLEDDLSFDHLSWSVKLSHYYSDDLSFYVAVDNAFKQGGFNPLVPGVFPLEQQFPQLFGDLADFARQVVTYEEETSDAFEVGVKGVALNRQLRFSLALFYQEFQDHQVGFPSDVVALGDIAGLFNNQIGNADEVLTQGVEFDLQYLLGDWDLSLRGAYFDATIEKWDRRLCPGGEEPALPPGGDPLRDQLFCPSDGDALNELPRWQTNMQLAYSRGLAERWRAVGRLNWTWQSEPARQGLAESDDPQAPDVSRFDEDKSRIDLTLSLVRDSGLELRLWAKNITDEDLNIDPGRFRDTQTLVGSHHPGREYGLTVRYPF
ncbi:MAG: TonB-dependent receptor, partial [Halioglobus sp.]|nr:TonB-dependent receptor [Halioglobus sp.]